MINGCNKNYNGNKLFLAHFNSGFGRYRAFNRLSIIKKSPPPPQDFFKVTNRNPTIELIRPSIIILFYKMTLQSCVLTTPVASRSLTRHNSLRSLNRNAVRKKVISHLSLFWIGPYELYEQGLATFSFTCSLFRQGSTASKMQPKTGVVFK